MAEYKFRALSSQIAAVLVGALSLVGSSGVQSAPSADVQRQVDEAFGEVIAKVDSREARLKYARLLIKAENYEGGIAAMEGLLLSPNAPPSIRVELAVLYFRLGSYGISEAYLREALADPRLDSDLRKQAEVMLVDVVKRNKINSLTGRLMVGLRGQSNPTAATSEAQVLSNSTMVPREDQSRPKSDVDGLLWGKLDHVYDLNTQNEASIVTTLVGLIDHYSSVGSYSYRPGSTKPYDVATIAGTTGVRFKPSPIGAQNFTLRPYLIFGEWLLNGHQYFTAGGLGLEGNYRQSNRLSWGGEYTQRHFSYESRPDITNSTLPSGVERSVKLHSVVELAANNILTGEIGFIDRGAERGDFAFSGPEARLAYVVTYLDPLANTGYNWTTTIMGRVLQRHYRETDPAIDSSTTRRDTDRRVGLLNVMPFTRDMALHVQLEYTNVLSNLPNYKYSNFAGTVGVLWNF